MYYTYLWLREEGIPYYVGKGSGNRAYNPRGHRCKVPPPDRIIIQEFESETDALFAEMFLIAAYGRISDCTGFLSNLTEGGEKPPVGSHAGHSHSDITRKLLSDKTKALWEDPEYAKHMSEAHKGQLFSEACRAKLRAARKGKAPNKGMKFSEETRKRMSAAQSGRKHSEDSKVKMRVSATERERRKKRCQICIE